MVRWLLGGALVIGLGLLAVLVVLVGGLATRGLTVRLVGPVELQDPLGVTVQGEIALHEPVEVALNDVSVRLPQPLLVQASPTELAVRASLEGLSCPECEEGLLIPVRWNLLTGEIVWRCSACQP